MSKTNHRRNFRSNKDSERYRHSPPAGTGILSPFADVHIGAHWGGDNSNGHRGYAKAKAGAKKFVRSRTRAKENQQLNKIVREENNGN